MKVAVATNNYKNVVGHIGHCKGFIIYDVENGEIKERREIENPFRQQNEREEAESGYGRGRGWGRGHGRGQGRGHGHGHGHGYGQGHHHNHDELVEAFDGAEVLLCKQAGPGLIESMDERGIKVLFTNERYGDDAVLKLEKNELEYVDPMEIM